MEFTADSVPTFSRSAQLLLKNMLFRDKRSGTVFRLLHVDAPYNTCFILDCRKKGALPEIAQYGQIVRAWTSGDLELLADDPYLPTRTSGQVNESTEKRAAARLELIRPLIRLEVDLFDPLKRGALIREIVSAGRSTKPTLYAALRAWWRGGMTKAALFSNHDRCGVSDKPRAEPRSKPGRPRRPGRGTGVAAWRFAKKMLLAHLAYKRSRDVRYRAAYLFYCALYHPEWMTIESGKPELKEGALEHVPTPEQYKYQVSKELGLLHLPRAAQRKAKKELRHFFDTAKRDSRGPGHYYVLDATIADIYLISALDRTAIVGRPTLYLVIDVFTGLIVGLWVSLDPPNWASAAKALANCAQNKVEFCARYGISISEYMWPTAGLAPNVLGDNGEVASHAAEQLLFVPGSSVANASPYNPQGKGPVEGEMRWTQVTSLEAVPGKVEKNWTRRDGPDYRLDGKLTLDDFFATVIRGVIDRNFSVRKARDPDPDLAEAGVAAHPVELWHYAAENIGCYGMAFPYEALRLQLLPIVTGVPTPQGLRVSGILRYDTTPLFDRSWYREALLKRRSLKVKIDSDCIDHVYVIDPLNTREIVVLELVPRLAKLRGMSLAALNALRRRVSDLNYLSDVTWRPLLAANEKARVDAVNAAVQLSNKAQQRQASSASARLNGIAANKQAERAHFSAQTALRPPTHVSQAGVEACALEQMYEESDTSALAQLEVVRNQSGEPQ